MLVCVLIATLFAIHSSATTGEEIPEERLQKIESLDYRGIGFSTTQEDLLRLFPNIGRENAHKGVATYEIRDDPDKDCVLLRFVNGDLIEIDFIYFPSRVRDLGGEAALQSWAVELLGTPTREEGKTFLWDFPTINRIVVTSYEHKQWSFHIYDRARRLSIPGYQDASASPEPARIKITRGPAVPPVVRPQKTEPRYSTARNEGLHKPKSHKPRNDIRSIGMESIHWPRDTEPTPGSTSTAIAELPGQVMEALSHHAKLVACVCLAVGCYLFLVTRHIRENDSDPPVTSRLRYVMRSPEPRPRPDSEIALNYLTNLSNPDTYVGNQIQAYHLWNGYKCPEEVPPQVFEELKGTISRDYSHNYSVMFDVLSRQLSAYTTLMNMAKPTGVEESHFVALKSLAMRKYPSSYPAQLFALNEFVNEYLSYYGSGKVGGSDKIDGDNLRILQVLNLS